MELATSGHGFWGVWSGSMGSFGPKVMVFGAKVQWTYVPTYGRAAVLQAHQRKVMVHGGDNACGQKYDRRTRSLAVKVLHHRVSAERSCSMGRDCLVIGAIPGESHLPKVMVCGASQAGARPPNRCLAETSALTVCRKVMVYGAIPISGRALHQVGVYGA